MWYSITWLLKTSEITTSLHLTTALWRVRSQSRLSTMSTIHAMRHTFKHQKKFATWTHMYDFKRTWLKKYGCKYRTTTKMIVECFSYCIFFKMLNYCIVIIFSWMLQSMYLFKPKSSNCFSFSIFNMYVGFLSWMLINVSYFIFLSNSVIFNSSMCEIFLNQLLVFFFKKKIFQLVVLSNYYTQLIFYKNNGAKQQSKT